MARQPEVCRRLSSMAECSGAPKLGRISLLMSFLILATVTLINFGTLRAIAFEQPIVDAQEKTAVPTQINVGADSIPPSTENSAVDDEQQTTEAPPFRVGDDADARIRFVATSIQAIEDDLGWLIRLSPTAKLQGQWPKFKEDILGAFTQGIDPKLPLEMDLALRDGSLKTEVCVPIVSAANQKAFLENIKGMGFRARNRDVDLYEFSEKGQPANYLRFDQGHAWTSSSISAVSAKLPSAADAMASLLNRKMDIVVDINNSAEGSRARKNWFAEILGSGSGDDQRQPNQAQPDLEPQEYRDEQWLELVARLFVEAKTLQAGWTTSAGPGVPFGRGRFQLTALPGTGLQQSLRAFGTKPSRFTNVVLHPNPIISGKTVYPLDALFTAQLERMLDDNRQELTDQTHAGAKIQLHIYDLISGTLKLGVLDAFVDVHRDVAGNHAFVCAARTANAALVHEIVPLLDQSDSGWKAGRGLLEHSGVPIHRIIVPTSHQNGLYGWLEGQSTIYVASRNDIVWSAAGKDALNQLKIAIDQTTTLGLPIVDPVVTRYRIDLAETAKLIESILTREEPPKVSPKNLADGNNELLKYCRLIRSASPDNEPFVRGELKRTSTGIEGYIQFDASAMKVLGTLIADLIRQVLD